MGGSQLKQLKEAISGAGLARKSQPNSKKRKRGSSGSIGEQKEKRLSKIQDIHERFNQFDIKVTKLKHDVGGRKLKGVVGKPTASKQAGIEQRKKTLLAEFNEKGKAGAVLDRRFGENDPTMSLEERMLERFTKERQRTSKGTAFNLEDEDELTHYGKSLSKLDDFDDVGLLEDDEDEKGQIDADVVRKVHFGGFSDAEEDEDHTEGPPRKKTKAEVMSEVMAKSKEHKYARQLQREQDENTRHQLDEDFDSIRGILFGGKAITEPLSNGSGSNALPLPTTEAPKFTSAAKEDDYDHLVKELVFDKRSQPKDRTKTEEEIALEEKEALEKAERARLKRMMGEEASDSDGEGGRRRKRPRGGDDLDDDFVDEEDEQEGWEGMGAGLQTAQKIQSDDEGDEDSQVSGSEGSEEESDQDSDEVMEGASSADEDEAGSFEPLISRKPNKASSKGTRKEVPFTFTCPQSHEELLDIIDGYSDEDVATILDRIRKLYHPSLGENNKYKLQTLLGVILDHILYVSSEPSTNTLLPTLVTHLTSLSKTYPIKSAEAFVSKLTLMQKNLVRGLQAPLETSSRTFPGTAELMLLKVLGETWSTSDMKHPVVGPARYLMASYLGLGRIRSVKDLASGMFLCTLFLDYERDSKRFVPETINFLINAVLILSLTELDELPGSFPCEDFLQTHTEELSIRLTKAQKGYKAGRPDLFGILNDGPIDQNQAKVDLLATAIVSLGRFSEMYKHLEGFIELYEPVVKVLKLAKVPGLCQDLQDRIKAELEHLTRLLKFSREGRRPLQLQSHKPIPIATYIPKFSSSSSSYMRARDPDAEKQQAAKLRAQYRQEKKGAMRELRKDNRFLAGVVQDKKEAEDRRYQEHIKRAMGSLEGERAEQKKEQREKDRAKRRAGKK